MSLETTYEWAKKTREFWESANENGEPGVKELGTELSQGGDHKVTPVEFKKVCSDFFVGEVAEVRGDLIFHIWPTSVPSDFEDIMGDAFLKVFKFEDMLAADYVPELEAWAVKASGFGNNLCRDELAMDLFVSLNDALTFLS